tara:strand:+ start:5747 stop:6586 length:840 start_codon:yes stop_codon:yes gene_type:complete
MKLVTISDALFFGNKHLKKISSNYKNESIWILSKCINASYTEIILKHKHKINKDEILDYKKLIFRRKNREPLQHILKSVPFYGRKFKTFQNVFICRPETEAIIDLLKSLNRKFNNVLEVGSGLGVLPITLELEMISSSITSLDINKHAISASIKNADNHKCKNITFIKENLFHFKTNKKFDLIISNPPYIPIQDLKKLDLEVMLFDPLNALTDYKDGLSFYRFFLAQSEKYLEDNGLILFEFGGMRQINDIKKILKLSNYKYFIYNDLNKEPRFIILEK